MAVRKPIYTTSFIQNLLTYSQDFANSDWTKSLTTITTNSTTAPDGTTTADKMLATATTQGFIEQSPTVTVGQPYTFSIYAKAGDNNWFRITNQSSGTSGGWFNLTDGTLGTQNGAGNVSSITSVGDGWYRCVRTFPSVVSGTQTVLYGNSISDGVGNPPENKFIYIWGAQAEAGSTVSEYIPTTAVIRSISGGLKEMTTAMVNEIVDQTVYQYSLSPSVALSVVSSGGSLGTLADTRLQAGAVSNSSTAFPNEATTAEPTTVTVNFAKITSADASVSPTADTGKTWPAYLTSVYTNTAKYSQALENARWGKTNVTVTANQTTAPDGTTTADLVVPNTNNAHHYVSSANGNFGTHASGETWTLSVFAKTAGYDYIKFFTSSSQASALFNIANGTFVGGAGAKFISGAITNVGNGWYRCSMTSDGIDNDDGGVYVHSTTFSPINQTYSYAGNGTDGAYLWGMQMEEESFMSSYIPTTNIIKSAGGDFKSMSLADIKDTFLHPAIDLLVSGSTGTQQGGTYHISTATSVGGSTEVSGSNTPIFTDTRADTSLYSAAGIPEALDQPTTISNYYLHKITGSDTSYTLPIFTTATNQTQSYPEATFESLLQEWIRYTAASSGDGYEINYSYTTGTNRGSGMGDTTLNGTGDYQTLQVGDDYRAQEFPNGTAVTTNTYYLKINKS